MVDFENVLLQSVVTVSQYAIRCFVFAREKYKRMQLKPIF